MILMMSLRLPSPAILTRADDHGGRAIPTKLCNYRIGSVVCHMLNNFATVYCANAGATAACEASWSNNPISLAKLLVVMLS